MDELVKRVAEALLGGGPNIVFTGAGISTESGISDYRSKGGIWDKFQPVYFDAFMSSRDARVEYWQQRIEMHRDLAKAAPNPAHKAVAELYNMGLVEAVITQNIDGLHQAAGVSDTAVIELHGNTRRIRCMSCGEICGEGETVQRIEAGDPAPECRCGGYLKPDTISFGQAMPQAALERCVTLSRACRVFLVVGSTLVVHPAARMPMFAKENGAFLAIVNLSDTPLDSYADVCITGKAGETLPRILETVKQPSP
jgi:NAD-dependent deacetylase